MSLCRDSNVAPDVEAKYLSGERALFRLDVSLRIADYKKIFVFTGLELIIHRSIFMPLKDHAGYHWLREIFERNMDV